MKIVKKTIGIIVSRFNEEITNNLYLGAKNTFLENGYEDEQLTTYFVPGAFEIPLVAQKMAQTNRFDALVTLGAVIRGETPHFDYVSSQVAAGVMRVSLDFSLPVIFGVLTTDTLDQAQRRSEINGPNKGCEAANTALQLIDLEVNDAQLSVVKEFLRAE